MTLSRIRSTHHQQTPNHDEQIARRNGRRVIMALFFAAVGLATLGGTHLSASWGTGMTVAGVVGAMLIGANILGSDDK